MNFNVALFLLTAPLLVQAESNLRGADADRLLGVSYTAGYGEKLGACTGAVCNVYGDPHVLTCDGLAYDCQASGIFTLMNNAMFNMQGHFANITNPEHVPNQLKTAPAASLFNDIVVDFRPNDDYPIVQLGFGDVSKKYGEFTSEIGCARHQHYAPQPPQKDNTQEASVYDCRETCKNTDGCVKFSYNYNGRCELHTDDPTIQLVDTSGSWSLSLSGTLDSECGVLRPYESNVEAERLFHGSIGGNKKQECPLLLHVDGELQDISHFQGAQSGYLYGAKDDDMSIKIKHSTVTVRYKLESGDIAEIRLQQGGKGPGERWGCNWSMYLCLPESGKDLYENSLGLLGTINGNTQDDWMDQLGNTLLIDNMDPNNSRKKNHQATFDYCKGNWCVSQEDSIMAYTGGMTYDDTKCHEEEYIDLNVNSELCVISASKIIQSCAEVAPLLKFACELDCCLGGCEDFLNTFETITGITELSTEDEDNVMTVPNHDECDDETFSNTGNTVCGGSDENSIVKIIHSSGAIDLPEGAEVIYGIVTDVDPEDESELKTIKFHVNNPFDDDVDIYVKHDKSLFSASCDSMIETPTGCNTVADTIEVVCRDYSGVAPFALVEVFFSSVAIPSSETSVDKCCYPEASGGPAGGPAGAGVISFTFEIQCECPNTVTE